MDKASHLEKIIKNIGKATALSRGILSKFTNDEIAGCQDSELKIVHDLCKKIDSAETPAEKNPFMEQLVFLRGVRGAVMVRDIAALIEQEGGPEYLDPWRLSVLMFSMGVSAGDAENLKLRGLPEYRAMIHSVRSSEIVGERRYAEYREDYEQALQEAEEYWSAGGTDLHNVLVKRLGKKYNLNANGLKKQLAPMARKYDRCFGDKGVKKIA